MADRIVLDYSNMLSTRLDGRGLDPARIRRAADRFRTVHAAVEERRAAGELEMFELPARRDAVDRVLEFDREQGGAFDSVVVLGIGGSALGAIALRRALAGPFWNELDDEARRGRPRLYVLDNVDPSTAGALLDRIDLRRTLFNVVSKSGTTAETMAQFQIVRRRLADELGAEAVRRHLVFTTDPEAGVLRRIAREEGIAALPIPPAVGGRFSVLSAVGLLPAALIGIDVAALLDGAAAMVDRCATDALEENPAGLFATLQHLADSEASAPIHVMMAYADRLYGVADWFRQLWAESLGKRESRTGAEVFRGPTPVEAIGATDQHSQVQLYMEGPFDKTVTFLAVRDRGRDLTIPKAYPDIDALAYLGGRSLGELLDAERRATARALSSAGRMNMTITLPAVDEHALGQLLMMLQIATVYAGELYDVNPLDQPGVELGKRLTYGLMGRPGYEPPSEDSPGREWVCG